VVVVSTFGLLATHLSACGGGEREPLPGSGKASAGDAAISTKQPVERPPGQEAPAEPQETGVALPLKLEGIGSKAELDRALAKIADPELAASFELAFRKCFVTERRLRRYDEAMGAMATFTAAMPGFAPAYRVMAYARFNLSFDMPGATELYQKAVDADPNYGEAHYALAFMLTQSDLERGRRHFERAMELGVPDERSLREQFYQ
jgi:tetratricopeptide (TPR) repeat protein